MPSLTSSLGSLLFTGFFSFLIGAVVAFLASSLSFANRKKALELAAVEAKGQLDQITYRLELEQQKQKETEDTLAKVKDEMKSVFAQLASDVFRENSSHFFKQSSAFFHKDQHIFKTETDKRHADFDALVKGISENLNKVKEKIETSDKESIGRASSINALMGELKLSQAGLIKGTENLSRALGTSKVRGLWGELQLKRTVELAGMEEHVNYSVQTRVESDDKTYIPDMVVHLPKGRILLVDAKAAMSAYLEAVEAADPVLRSAKLKQHAEQVRSRVKELSSKEYWAKFPKEDTPDFVMLFLPGEVFYQAALENDPKLFEDAFEKKVILTSPAILVALLKTIAFNWREERLAKEAREIANLGNELLERIGNFSSTFNRLGDALKSATNHYNTAAGSVEGRLLVTARRLQSYAPENKELDKKLETPEQLDFDPRLLKIEELPEDQRPRVV